MQPWARVVVAVAAGRVAIALARYLSGQIICRTPRPLPLAENWAHLAHKAEHAVDLETGAVLGVTVQDADDGVRSGPSQQRIRQHTRRKPPT